MLQDLPLSLIERTEAFLLSPGSSLSLWSLCGALTLAVGVTLAKRGGRDISLRTMIRAMFPHHRLFGASARADLGFTLIAVFVSSTLFGWAVISHLAVSTVVERALGQPLAPGLPTWLAVAAITFALWLAYEFAYWLDHYLSHKWRWLWAFHKVHHSAETLSPLTVFRVHPVDSIVFYNIVALVTGVTAGMMHWLVGAGVEPLALYGTNALTLVGLFTIKHLHHSHVWISWGGIWGRLLLSPAHHQIHHSVAPEHHDRNFGDTLALFDWLAGTLHQPAAKREALTFGVNGYADPHSASGALLAPFADAARSAAPSPQPTLSPR